ncbi:MAG: ribonuclease Z [Lachnospiraceae bacterium]|nr:ribonuclease Z [Lachnospiraceae bacterium]
MTVIVCSDDDMGIFFNKRRQSRDSAVTKRIVEITRGSILWLSSYSSQLFANERADNIIADDDFLSKAQNDDFCFVEGEDVSDHESKITKIVLFKWNRTYPHDMILNIDFNNFTLVQRCDFKGTSHKMITEEVWCR